MKKNVAGQSIGAEMITAADGSAFTGTVTVYITGDGGSQALGSVGSGVCTHKGNGYHSYAPAQGETDYDLAAFTFIGAGAIPATVQVFTGFPQTVDNNVLAAGANGFAALSGKLDGLVPTGDRTITLQIYETATTTPIVDVSVSILNEGETVTLAKGVTDSNGQYIVALDDATYKVRLRKAGGEFTVPETIVVTDDATEELFGDTIIIAAPADPDVCRVFDYLFLADGVTPQPAASIDVKAQITELPFDADGKLHSGDIIAEVYDEGTGLVYWDIVQGATVSFFVNDYIGIARVIPAEDTKRLVDIEV